MKGAPADFTACTALVGYLMDNCCAESAAEWGKGLKVDAIKAAPIPIPQAPT